MKKDVAEAGSQAKHNSSLAVFEYVTGYHVKRGENLCSLLSPQVYLKRQIVVPNKNFLAIRITLNKGTWHWKGVSSSFN